MNIKKEQLGEYPATASQRLQRNMLWHYMASHEACYHCGGNMTRETFSIEHKIPWLHSEDPVGLFFDLDNIAFSHLSCNKGARRGGKRSGPRKTTEEIKTYQAKYYQENKEKWKYKKSRAAYMRDYMKKRRTKALLADALGS